MEKIDINILQLQKREFGGFSNSLLKLEFSGESVNSSLVNTFRRCAYLYVPTYAFTSKSIYIEENTSIYNNDMLRLNFSQLTYPKLKNKFTIIPERYWKNIDYSDNQRERFKGDTINIDLYINVANKTSDIMNVTSNDFKIFENGNQIKLEDKFDVDNPHLLVKLKPGQSLKCKLVPVLGLGLSNCVWSAVGNSYYEDINEHKYILSLESQGQLDEYDILDKSCLILIKKLEDIKLIISEKYNNEELIKKSEIILRLENEDHTIGIFLNEYLQQNKNIKFSGCTKPDLLIREIVIKIMSEKPNCIKYIFETIDYCIQLINEIKKQINKLGHKYI